MMAPLLVPMGSRSSCLWLLVATVASLSHPSCLVAGWPNPALPGIIEDHARRYTSSTNQRRWEGQPQHQHRKNDGVLICHEQRHLLVARLRRRIPSKLCRSLSSSSSSSHEATASEPPATSSSRSSESHLWFQIRDCAYGELGQVADVIVASFYAHEASPWKQLYRLGELNRIQQSFSRGGEDQHRHRMLVAVTTSIAGPQNPPNNGSGTSSSSSSMTVEGRILGFCDLDDRPPTRYTGYAHNPRPYVSDVCVHPDHRRQGVARALLRRCEEVCRTELRRSEVYVRVESTNDGALRAYERLGYHRWEEEQALPPGPFPPSSSSRRSDPNIWLLRKTLMSKERVDDDSDGDGILRRSILY